MTDEEIRKMFHDFLVREAQLKRFMELGERIKQLRPCEISRALGSDALKIMEKAQRAVAQIQPAIEAMDAMRKAMGA